MYSDWLSCWWRSQTIWKPHNYSPVRSQGCIDIHWFFIWLYFGILLHVDQCSGVSEENVAFIFRVSCWFTRMLRWIRGEKSSVLFGGRWKTVPWLSMARHRAATFLHNRHIPLLPTTLASTRTSTSNFEDGGGMFLRNFGVPSITQLICPLGLLRCDMCQSCFDRRVSRNSEVMTRFIALVNCDGRAISWRILQVNIRDRTV
jgi:hypothetical protein